MRERLFRGLDKDHGVWRYGSLIEYDSGQTVIVFYAERYGYGVYTNEVIPKTIGQYTGFDDKNGKKIFEGDIVACGDGKVPTEIRWVQESSAFMAYNLKRKEYHLLNKYFDRFIGEVIGNVHDNPELLEVSE